MLKFSKFGKLQKKVLFKGFRRKVDKFARSRKKIAGIKMKFRREKI